MSPDGTWQVIVDGEPAATGLAGVLDGSLVLSADGSRAAWGQRSDAGWSVAWGDTLSEPVTGLGKVGLGPPILSPSGRHVVYAARTPDGDVLVHDDARTPLTGGLTQAVFSSTGEHLVVVTQDDAGHHLTRDGAALGTWPDLGDVTAAPAGERWAYSRQTADGWQVVLDGEPASTHERLGSPGAVFSPDGAHVAWWALDSGVQAVHRDGVAGVPWGAIGELPLTWSADGQHLAWLAHEVGQTADRTWKVVLDGEPVSQREEVAALAVDATGAHVAWVAREGAGWVVRLHTKGRGLRSTSIVEAVGTDLGGGVGFAGGVLRYTTVDGAGLHLHELTLGS